MKTIRQLLALLLALVLVCALIPAAFAAAPAAPAEPNAGDVNINATNFPDERFRNFVTVYDANNNGVLSQAERAVVQEMDCSERQIRNLKGIEHFTALRRLDCWHNYLNSLDLSQNTALTYLDCSMNQQLTSLNLNTNAALEELWCGSCSLSSLDVSSHSNLETLNLYDSPYLTALDCSVCALSSLDVRECPVLKSLSCYYNELTSLDLSDNETLQTLVCAGNDLTSLNLSKNTALKVLDCSKNSLTGLDLTRNTALEELECYENELTSLNLSKNTELKRLVCGRTPLISLDVSNHSKLSYLDVGRCMDLKSLYCSQCDLETLYVGSCPKLETLVCFANQLTSLDVTSNPALKDLQCLINNLTTLDLRKTPALNYTVGFYRWQNRVPNHNPHMNYDEYTSPRGELVVDDSVELLVTVNPFQDVPAGKYYYMPVLWAYYHDPQVTGGTDSDRFSPNQTCTREQIVTFLYAAYGKPGHHQSSSPFKDVTKGKYYYDPVMWAVESFITSGVEDDRFGVGEPCTREQVMTFLWKAAGSPNPSSSYNPFDDVTPGKYYYKAILWAVQKGITGGVEPNLFGVGETCTRGQIVTFLYALLGPKG